MKTLATDSTYDIFLDTATGSLAVHTGNDAYADIVAAAIRTVKGEIQLDTEEGVPYFDTVFKSVGRVNLWKALVENRVNKFPFVRSIVSFTHNIDFENRILHYTLIINTDIGEVTITV